MASYSSVANSSLLSSTTSSNANSGLSSSLSIHSPATSSAAADQSSLQQRFVTSIYPPLVPLTSLLQQ